MAQSDFFAKRVASAAENYNKIGNEMEDDRGVLLKPNRERGHPPD